jgi:hypothetical protein
MSVLSNTLGAQEVQTIRSDNGRHRAHEMGLRSRTLRGTSCWSSCGRWTGCGPSLQTRWSDPCRCCAPSALACCRTEQGTCVLRLQTSKTYSPPTTTNNKRASWLVLGVMVCSQLRNHCGASHKCACYRVSYLMMASISASERKLSRVTTHGDSDRTLISYRSPNLFGNHSELH